MANDPPYIRKAHKRYLIKSVALTLILCLFFQEFLYADPEAFKAIHIPLKASNSVMNLKLPDSIAVVEDSYGVSGGSKIILIQDPHTNVSGQENIAKVVEQLIAESPKTSVFVEGGFGDVSLTSLKAADEGLRKQTAEKYLKKGELSGAEYQNLISGENFTLYGVEDRELYFQSLEVYRDIVSQRKKFTEYIQSIENTIEVLKPKLLNPFVLTYVNKRQSFLSEKISLTEYFEFLFLQASIHGISLSDLPNLQIFRKLQKQEKLIDFPSAQKEQLKAVKALALKGHDPESISKLTAGDHSQIRAFFALLEEDLKKDKKSSELYPNLLRYFDYLRMSDQFNAKQILDEQKNLEARLVKTLIENEDEGRLIQASDAVRGLRALLNLTLTPDEFHSYEVMPDNFNITQMTGFLNKKLMELNGPYDKAVFLEKGYEDIVKNCEEFYHLTLKRDEKMVENMLKARNTSADKISSDFDQNTCSILISGGYHTPNLKAILKKKNISFVSVTPRIANETNLKRYEELLLSEKSEIKIKNDDVSTKTLAILATANRPEDSRMVTVGRLGEEMVVQGVRLVESKPAVVNVRAIWNACFNKISIDAGLTSRVKGIESIPASVNLYLAPTDFFEKNMRSHFSPEECLQIVISETLSNALVEPSDGIVDVAFNSNPDQSTATLMIRNRNPVDYDQLRLRLTEALEKNELYSNSESTQLYVVPASARQQHNAGFLNSIHLVNSEDEISKIIAAQGGRESLPFIIGLGRKKDPHPILKGGKGLGLEVIRNYTREIGGVYTLQSVEGFGTVVSITFPLAPSAQIVSRKEEPATSGGRLGSSNPLTINSLESAIREAAMETHTALQGEHPGVSFEGVLTGGVQYMQSLDRNDWDVALVISDPAIRDKAVEIFLEKFKTRLALFDISLEEPEDYIQEPGMPLERELHFADDSTKPIEIFVNGSWDDVVMNVSMALQLRIRDDVKYSLAIQYFLGNEATYREMLKDFSTLGEHSFKTKWADEIARLTALSRGVDGEEKNATRARILRNNELIERKLTNRTPSGGKNRENEVTVQDNITIIRNINIATIGNTIKNLIENPESGMVSWMASQNERGFELALTSKESVLHIDLIKAMGIHWQSGVRVLIEGGGTPNAWISAVPIYFSAHPETSTIEYLKTLVLLSKSVPAQAMVRTPPYLNHIFYTSIVDEVPDARPIHEVAKIAEDYLAADQTLLGARFSGTDAKKSAYAEALTAFEQFAARYPAGLESMIELDEISKFASLSRQLRQTRDILLQDLMANWDELDVNKKKLEKDRLDYVEAEFRTTISKKAKVSLDRQVREIKAVLRLAGGVYERMAGAALEESVSEAVRQTAFEKSTLEEKLFLSAGVRLANSVEILPMNLQQIIQSAINDLNKKRAPGIKELVQIKSNELGEFRVEAIKPLPGSFHPKYALEWVIKELLVNAYDASLGQSKLSYVSITPDKNHVQISIENTGSIDLDELKKRLVRAGTDHQLYKAKNTGELMVFRNGVSIFGDSNYDKVKSRNARSAVGRFIRKYGLKELLFVEGLSSKNDTYDADDKKSGSGMGLATSRRRIREAFGGDLIVDQANLNLVRVIIKLNLANPIGVRLAQHRLPIDVITEAHDTLDTFFEEYFDDEQWYVDAPIDGETFHAPDGFEMDYESHSFIIPQDIQINSKEDFIRHTYFYLQALDVLQEKLKDEDVFYDLSEDLASVLRLSDTVCLWLMDYGYDEDWGLQAPEDVLGKFMDIGRELERLMSDVQPDISDGPDGGRLANRTPSGGFPWFPKKDAKPGDPGISPSSRGAEPGDYGTSGSRLAEVDVENPATHLETADEFLQVVQNQFLQRFEDSAQRRAVNFALKRLRVNLKKLSSLLRQHSGADRDIRTYFNMTSALAVSTRLEALFVFRVISEFLMPLRTDRSFDDLRHLLFNQAPSGNGGKLLVALEHVELFSVAYPLHELDLDRDEMLQDMVMLRSQIKPIRSAAKLIETINGISRWTNSVQQLVRSYQPFQNERLVASLRREAAALAGSLAEVRKEALPSIFKPKAADDAWGIIDDLEIDLKYAEDILSYLERTFGSRLAGVNEALLREIADHPLLADPIIALNKKGIHTFESHFGGPAHSFSLPADENSIIVPYLSSRNREIIQKAGYALAEPAYLRHDGTLTRRTLPGWDQRDSVNIGFKRDPDHDSPQEFERISGEWVKIVALLEDQDPYVASDEELAEFRFGIDDHLVEPFFSSRINAYDRNIIMNRFGDAGRRFVRPPSIGAFRSYIVRNYSSRDLASPLNIDLEQETQKAIAFLKTTNVPMIEDGSSGVRFASDKTPTQKAINIQESFRNGKKPGWNSVVTTLEAYAQEVISGKNMQLFSEFLNEARQNPRAGDESGTKDPRHLWVMVYPILNRIDTEKLKDPEVAKLFKQEIEILRTPLTWKQKRAQPEVLVLLFDAICSQNKQYSIFPNQAQWVEQKKEPGIGEELGKAYATVQLNHSLATIANWEDAIRRAGFEPDLFRDKKGIKIANTRRQKRPVRVYAYTQRDIRKGRWVASRDADLSLALVSAGSVKDLAASSEGLAFVDVALINSAESVKRFTLFGEVFSVSVSKDETDKKHALVLVDSKTLRPQAAFDEAGDQIYPAKDQFCIYEVPASEVSRVLSDMRKGIKPKLYKAMYHLRDEFFEKLPTSEDTVLILDGVNAVKYTQEDSRGFDRASFNLLQTNYSTALRTKPGKATALHVLLDRRTGFVQSAFDSKKGTQVYPDPSFTRVYINAKIADAKAENDSILWRAVSAFNKNFWKQPELEDADTVFLENVSISDNHGRVYISVDGYDYYTTHKDPHAGKGMYSAKLKKVYYGNTRANGKRSFRWVVDEIYDSTAGKKIYPDENQIQIHLADNKQAFTDPQNFYWATTSIQSTFWKRKEVQVAKYVILQGVQSKLFQRPGATVFYFNENYYQIFYPDIDASPRPRLKVIIDAKTKEPIEAYDMETGDRVYPSYRKYAAPSQRSQSSENLPKQRSLKAQYDALESIADKIDFLRRRSFSNSIFHEVKIDPVKLRELLWGYCLEFFPEDSRPAELYGMILDFAISYAKTYMPLAWEWSYTSLEDTLSSPEKDSEAILTAYLAEYKRLASANGFRLGGGADAGARFAANEIASKQAFDLHQSFRAGQKSDWTETVKVLEGYSREIFSEKNLSLFDEFLIEARQNSRAGDEAGQKNSGYLWTAVYPVLKALQDQDDEQIEQRLTEETSLLKQSLDGKRWGQSEVLNLIFDAVTSNDPNLSIFPQASKYESKLQNDLKSAYKFVQARHQIATLPSWVAAIERAGFDASEFMSEKAKKISKSRLRRSENKLEVYFDPVILQGKLVAGQMPFTTVTTVSKSLRQTIEEKKPSTIAIRGHLLRYDIPTQGAFSLNGEYATALPSKGASPTEILIVLDASSLNVLQVYDSNGTQIYPSQDQSMVYSSTLETMASDIEKLREGTEKPGFIKAVSIVTADLTAKLSEQGVEIALIDGVSAYKMTVQEDDLWARFNLMDNRFVTNIRSTKNKKHSLIVAVDTKTGRPQIAVDKKTGRQVYPNNKFARVYLDPSEGRRTLYATASGASVQLLEDNNFNQANVVVLEGLRPTRRQREGRNEPWASFRIFGKEYQTRIKYENSKNHYSVILKKIVIERKGKDPIILWVPQSISDMRTKKEVYPDPSFLRFYLADPAISNGQTVLYEASSHTPSTLWGRPEIKANRIFHVENIPVYKPDEEYLFYYNGGKFYKLDIPQGVTAPSKLRISVRSPKGEIKAADGLDANGRFFPAYLPANVHSEKKAKKTEVLEDEDGTSRSIYKRFTALGNIYDKINMIASNSSSQSFFNDAKLDRQTLGTILDEYFLSYDWADGSTQGAFNELKLFIFKYCKGYMPLAWEWIYQAIEEALDAKPSVAGKIFERHLKHAKMRAAASLHTDHSDEYLASGSRLAGKITTENISGLESSLSVNELPETGEQVTWRFNVLIADALKALKAAQEIFRKPSYVNGKKALAELQKAQEKYEEALTLESKIIVALTNTEALDMLMDEPRTNLEDFSQQLRDYTTLHTKPGFDKDIVEWDPSLANQLIDQSLAKIPLNPKQLDKTKNSLRVYLRSIEPGTLRLKTFVSWCAANNLLALVLPDDRPAAEVFADAFEFAEALSPEKDVKEDIQLQHEKIVKIFANEGKTKGKAAAEYQNADKFLGQFTLHRVGIHWSVVSIALLNDTQASDELKRVNLIALQKDFKDGALRTFKRVRDLLKSDSKFSGAVRRYQELLTSLTQLKSQTALEPIVADVKSEVSEPIVLESAKEAAPIPVLTLWGQVLEAADKSSVSKQNVNSDGSARARTVLKPQSASQMRRAAMSGKIVKSSLPQLSPAEPADFGFTDVNSMGWVRSLGPKEEFVILSDSPISIRVLDRDDVNDVVTLDIKEGSEHRIVAFRMKEADLYKLNDIIGIGVAKRKLIEIQSTAGDRRVPLFIRTLRGIRVGDPYFWTDGARHQGTRLAGRNNFRDVQDRIYSKLREASKLRKQAKRAKKEGDLEESQRLIAQAQDFERAVESDRAFIQRFKHSGARMVETQINDILDEIKNNIVGRDRYEEALKLYALRNRPESEGGNPGSFQMDLPESIDRSLVLLPLILLTDSSFSIDEIKKIKAIYQARLMEKVKQWDLDWYTALPDADDWFVYATTFYEDDNDLYRLSLERLALLVAPRKLLVRHSLFGSHLRKDKSALDIVDQQGSLLLLRRFLKDASFEIQNDSDILSGFFNGLIYQVDSSLQGFNPRQAPALQDRWGKLFNQLRISKHNAKTWVESFMKYASAKPGDPASFLRMAKFFEYDTQTFSRFNIEDIVEYNRKNPNNRISIEDFAFATPASEKFYATHCRNKSSDISDYEGYQIFKIFAEWVGVDTTGWPQTVGTRLTKSKDLLNYLYNNPDVSIDDTQAVVFIAKAADGTLGRKSGTLAIGAGKYSYEINEGSLIIQIPDGTTRTLSASQWSKIVHADQPLKNEIEVKFTAGDFKMLWDANNKKADDDKFADGPYGSPTVVEIDLDALNTDARTFNEIIIPLLAREIAVSAKKPWGANSRYVLKSIDETLKERVLNEAGKAGAASDLIVKDRSELKGIFGKLSPIRLTTPEHPPTDKQRRYYIEALSQGDFPNFRAAFRVALSLGRIADNDFSATDRRIQQIANFLTTVTGRNISPALLASVVRGGEDKDIAARHIIAVPGIVKLALDKLFAAARLAGQMTLQSA